VNGYTSPTQERTARIGWLDVAVAVGTAIAQVGGTELSVRFAGSERPLDPVAYALLLAGAASLVARDRYPLPVLLAVAASAVTYMLLGYPGGFSTISLALAIWASVSAGFRSASAVVVAGLVAIVVVAGLVVRSGHLRDPDAGLWFGGWLVAAFVLGEVSRSRRSYLEEVERRAFDAERTREEEARRRAGEERVRIARELHDVLTHHISVINVQAGVAVHLLDKQPDGSPLSEQAAQARQTLVTITESSREAMRELRDILGVLRQVDDTDPRAPTPGLDGLDDLVAGAAGAGLEIELETEGERRPLPLGTDLAAYRIIQESLTNVARHADARHATVSLRYGPEEIELEVADDGRGVPPGAELEGGNGLTGMRERAAAVGGSLEAGALPVGGFRVRARLPVQAPT
jgi:signal transduction histidine kinase